MLYHRTMLFGCLLATVSVWPPFVVAQSDADAWQADLRFLIEQLEAGHANLFHAVSQDVFYASVAALDQAIPELADHEIIVEIARLLALVEDGHTTAGLAFDILRPTTGFRKYPIRIGAFEEGFFITQATVEHADLVGKQILQVGSHPISAVFEAVTPLISRSKHNASILNWQAPELMVTAEVLHALGLTASLETAVFTLGTPDGPKETLSLTPIAIQRRAFNGQPPESVKDMSWVTVLDALPDRPLTHQQRDTPYWYTFLEDEQTVYFQYNNVRNAPNESFDAFCERLFAFLDTTPVEKFVIDMRFNQGGDGTLNWALIERIRRRPHYNQKGKIFALIGPQTFSAAMMAAVALERYTETLFVGQPTGASPNHYGDTGFLVLPHSGLALIHAEVYWQLSDPDDRRPWIAPDLPVPAFFVTFRQGQDAALDAILAYRP